MPDNSPNLAGLIGAPELAPPPPAAPPATTAPAPYKPISLVSPVSGPITSGFGQRSAPTEGATTNHQGIDYGVPLGTTVGAAASGQVEFAGPKGGYGNAVVIRHQDGSSTLYGHLSNIAVKQGDSVSAGTAIGASGATGTVTGPNLHFGYYSPTGKAIDPTSAFSGQGSGPDLAATIGLTPAEATAVQAHTAPDSAPGNPDAQPGSGTGHQFNYGSQFGKMSAAAEAAFQKIAADPARGIDSGAPEGSAKLPYYAPPGGPTPGTPGDHWVDINGAEHVVPGGLPEQLVQGAQGVFQGAVMDTLHSANKLFAGGISDLTRNPLGEPSGAQTSGLSSPSLTEQSIEGALQQQARDYSIEHLGSKSAQAGRFVGQMIPATAAAVAVPELDVPAVGGALTNALRGAAAAAPGVGPNSQPVAQQLLTGAVAGAVLPPALQKAGELGLGLSGVAGADVSPEIRDLASKAINTYGIPLRGTQIAGVENPALATRDVKLLGAGGSGYAANASQQQQAFTRAVAGTFGADADKLTPTVLNQARSDLGKKFENFAQTHSINDVDGLQVKLGQIVGDAQQVMPAGEVTPLLNTVKNIGDIAGSGPDRTIGGDAYLNLTSKGAPLDRLMQAGDSNIRHYATKIKDALDDGIAQSATPEELSDFSNTRLQYKNLMTLKGLAAKAGVTGQISPTQLQSVVNRSFDDRAFSGAGPLGELADIGQTFMGAQSPSKIAAVAQHNWLPGALGAGALGEAALGIGSKILNDPALALQLGAAAGVTKAGGFIRNALQSAEGGVGAGRALAGAQSPRNALGVLAEKAKPVVVPLSALAGVRLTPSPVGTNAQ